MTVILLTPQLVAAAATFVGDDASHVGALCVQKGTSMASVHSCMLLTLICNSKVVAVDVTIIT